MLCREPRDISLTVLSVNCHDATGKFLTGDCGAKKYERSFKMASPTRKKIKGFWEVWKEGSLRGRRSK